MKRARRIVSTVLTMAMVLSLINGIDVLKVSAGTPGTITNIVTKYNPATPTVARTTAVADAGLYIQQGSAGTPVTTTTGTNQERIDAALANNPYYTADKTKWAYGDRTTNAVYSGADANNPIWNMTQYAMVDTTSAVLLGDNVTKVLALNTEKNFTPTIPDLYSFTISKPATVYVVTPGSPDANFVTTNGWTKQTSMQAKRASITVIQGNDSKYYAVPNGSGSIGTVYSKHYGAETVNIPSRGATNSNGMVIFVVWDAGVVSAPVTKFNSAAPDTARTTAVTDTGLFAIKGSAGAPVTTYNESTGYTTNQERINAALASNPYFTADQTKWAYGDRTTNATFSGANADNPIWNMTIYAMVDSTSPILLGPNVTRLLALNTEKSFTPSISDLYTFSINNPATVYVASPGNPDTNFVINNGWTKETGLVANRASTAVLLGSDAKYYAVPNGATSIGTVYSKHYQEGTVNIPSRGASSNNGMVIFIVWDGYNPAPTLSELKVDGTMVDGFTPGNTTYDVFLPYGTTTVPTVTATSASGTAIKAITQATALPGSATVAVTAGDGVTNGTYTIHFTVETSVSYDCDDNTGSVMFEAEQTTLNAAAFSVTTDASASGGNAISALISQATVPDSSVSGASFYINPDRATPYSVWIRYSATSAQNSLYLSVDGGAYAAKTLTANSSYQWTKLYTTGNQPSETTKFNFKIYPAKAGLKIDQIIVTTYPFFTPSGVVTTLDNMAFGYSLPSTTYPTPTITPPSAHPRLMFKSSDIAGIQANMQTSQNANALSAYTNYLSITVDGNLPPIVLDSGTNYNGTALATIEAYALKYALDGDTAYGNKAISAIKNYLHTVAFTDSVMDITRSMGHTIFVSSEVYDWCYPLLTASDKNYIIVAGEALAKRMETNYPPAGQGAVTGHGGEAQLLRDVLSFGIATYNERPDIYNYVAGRLLSQFIQPRDYWFASNTHNQGDSYGNYRHQWELYFQWIMFRMSDATVFSPDAEFIPYQWIYTRRPDGQEFRNGDSWQDKGSAIGTYWTSDVTATFLSSNFYNNSYVKNLFIAASPNFNPFSVNNGGLTPVTYLLLNNPDLGGVSHTSTFPLTKYFGSPYGMMVARTGWVEPGTVDQSSNIAMAQMVIGEQWAANHQHLDAGTFQLYYKGALASESGIYDEYGSNHDKNYNKETIAHNALLIKDPNETIYGGAVNSGGQRRPGGEVNTYAQWMSAGYDTGDVLDQAYDTNNAVPQYSYIKGDITRAYSSKVSEVLRSMMFIPLSDASHPAAFVVMDKVTSSNAAFAKTWLLHTQQDFTLSGNTAIVKRDTDGYNGRMDLATLLPSDATLTKVGGFGNEFNINGTNYAPVSMGGVGCEHGSYRLEVSPGSANATDYFFNVMQVSDASANATPLTTTLIETTAVAGVKISDRVAVFGKNKDRMTGAIEFTVPGTETSGLKLTVAGVAEGPWTVYNDTVRLSTVTVTSDGGILSFEGGAGSYRIVQPGTVSNLLTKYNPSTPTVARTTGVTDTGLYAVLGSTGAPATTTTGTNQQRIDAALNGGTATAPLGNPYFTADKTRWAYGDRNTNGVFSGADANNPIWNMTQYAMTDTTAPVLLGQTVTKVLALNTEKNFTPVIPDVYSFTISKPATVYTSVPGNPDANFVTNNGWTKTALQAMHGAISIVQGTNSLYYAVPSGTNHFGTVYSKHYEAGTVNIPSRGASSYNGMVMFVVWDE